MPLCPGPCAGAFCSGNLGEIHITKDKSRGIVEFLPLLLFASCVASLPVFVKHIAVELAPLAIEIRPISVGFHFSAEHLIHCVRLGDALFLDELFHHASGCLYRLHANVKRVLWPVLHRPLLRFDLWLALLGAGVFAMDGSEQEIVDERHSPLWRALLA